MDLSLLLDEILTGPLAAEFAPHIASGNDAAIAERLNALTESGITPRFCNARTILAEYASGPMDGAALLDKLDAAAASIPALRWIMTFVKSDEGFDIGHPASQATLDQLALGGVITSAEAENLKSLARKPISRAQAVFGRPVEIQEIAQALRG